MGNIRRLSVINISCSPPITDYVVNKGSLLETPPEPGEAENVPRNEPFEEHG